MFTLASVLSAALVGLSALPTSTLAQQSTAECVYASWASNGDNQTPCQVWATLGSKCGTFNVRPLAAYVNGVSDSYGAPAAGGQIPNNDCQCNHIAYSLMAACSWCQKDVYADSWVEESAWAAACSNYGNSSIASTVDTNGINIPPYSLEPIPGPFWDPTDAQAAQVRLGSSGTAQGSTSNTGGNGGHGGNGTHSGALSGTSVGLAAIMAVFAAPLVYLF